MRVLQGVKGLGFRGPGYADGLGMFWAYLDGRPPQTVKRGLRIGIGFGGPIYYNYETKRNPQNPILIVKLPTPKGPST